MPAGVSQKERSEALKLRSEAVRRVSEYTSACLSHQQIDEEHPKRQQQREIEKSRTGIA